MAKYSNRKTEINGIVFDSAKEARICSIWEAKAE